MEFPIVIARLLLAAVLIVSAIAKWRDREGSREAVAAFGVPGPLVAVVAFALPVLETVCAVLLLLSDPFATAGAALSLITLGTFTIGIIINLLRGNRPQCRCFGALSGTEAIGWNSVARNGALMALATVPLLDAGNLRSVVAEVAALDDVDGWLFLLVLVLSGAVAVMAFVLRELVRRYGHVLNRLETLEQMAGIAEPKEAPAFRLYDTSGTELAEAEVISSEIPTMLVFVSPTCHNCTGLLPDLATWQKDEDHPMRVVVVSDGSQEDINEKFDHSGVGVLRQHRWDVADAFAIEGTPAAVLVGPDGLVAGPPAHGIDRVRDMHQRLHGAMRQPSPRAEGSTHSIGQRPPSPGDDLPDALVIPEEGHSPLPVAEVVGSSTVLLFWRTTCGFCQGILDDVRRWEGRVDVRLVTDSTVDEIRASGLHSPSLQDVGRSLNDFLQVPGTPSAVWVKDGRLASEVAVGGPAVLSVIGRAASASVQEEAPRPS